MAVAFGAAGTGSTGNPSWPSHSAGHLGVLFVETVSGAITTPSGWTAIGQMSQPGIAATTLSVFWKIAASGAESAPTIAGGSDHTWAVILTWTGTDIDTPFVRASWVTMAAGGTTLYFPGGQIPVSDAVVLNVFAWSGDSTGPFATTFTNTTVTLTERFDAGTTSGNGGGLAISDGPITGPGLVDPTILTAVSSNGVLALMVLQPPDADVDPPDTSAVYISTKSSVVHGGPVG